MCILRDLTCLILLWLVLSPINASVTFTVKSAESIITAKWNSSVILPCWLSEPISAVDMEIRWYRPEKYSTPVLLYQNGQLKTDQQEDTYRNRSSLTVRGVQSTGLNQGDVSLKLDNVSPLDDGEFICYVSSDRTYNSNHVNLSVSVIGTSPVVSLQYDGNSFNASCSSCGWFPKPSITWKDNESSKVYLRPQPPHYRTEDNGLFCVSSWIRPSYASNSIYCSIALSAIEKKDVSMVVSSFGYLTGMWKALFAATFIALALVIFCICVLYKKHQKVCGAGYMPAKRDDEIDAVCEHNMININDLRKSAVNIELDPSRSSEYVTITKYAARDTKKAGEVFIGYPYELCVFGSRPISEGCAYWEVGLKAENVTIKQSWLIGVANASYTLSSADAYNEMNGFWYLCSDPSDGLCVSTKPKISLPVKNLPESIGVLLEKQTNEGKISFYDTKEGVHLFTMKVSFTENIVPLFNPGVGDGSPLRILDNPKMTFHVNDTNQHQ